MARILKCPKCNTPWRLPDDTPAEALFECGACGERFAQTVAETLEVPDDILREALATKQSATTSAINLPSAPPPAEPAVPAAERPQEAPKLPKAEVPPTLLTQEPTLSQASFEKSDKVTEHLSADPRPAVYVPERHPLRTFFLLLLGLFFAAVICASAMLYINSAVLARAPWLRPVYENVCTKVPCPGFSWSNSEALDVRASLRDDPALGMLLPSVNIYITNMSALPQQLPVLEVRVFDAARAAIGAPRVLEPADYGFMDPHPVLPAGQMVESLVHFHSTLPVEAASVNVRVVTNDSTR